jgi:hypothetical protein
MKVADLKMHSFVETAHGKGMVIATETPRLSPGVFDLERVKVKVFFEPNKLFPRGTERNFEVADISPWSEVETFRRA